MMTERLAEFIEREALRRTFVDVADDVGISEGTVRGVFGDYVKRLKREVFIVTPDLYPLFHYTTGLFFCG